MNSNFFYSLSEIKPSPKNPIVHILVASFVGLIIGLSIQYFRTVEQAPLMCVFGSVLFAMAHRRYFNSSKKV